MNISEHVDKFKQEMKRMNYARNTIENYRNLYSHFPQLNQQNSITTFSDKTMTQQQRFDTQILTALFMVTTEYSTHVNKTYKHKCSQEFKRWQDQGFKMLNEFEKMNLTQHEQIQEIADQIHNIIAGAKKLSLTETVQHEEIN